MTANHQDIKDWLDEGLKSNARWVIIGLDRFDYENYPIYVNADEDPWATISHLGDNGTGGMGDSYDEVYDLNLDIEAQLNERRAYHLPPRKDMTLDSPIEVARE